MKKITCLKWPGDIPECFATWMTWLQGGILNHLQYGNFKWLTVTASYIKQLAHISVFHIWFPDLVFLNWPQDIAHRLQSSTHFLGYKPHWLGVFPHRVCQNDLWAPRDRGACQVPGSISFGLSSYHPQLSSQAVTPTGGETAPLATTEMIHQLFARFEGILLVGKTKGLEPSLVGRRHSLT